MSDYGVVVVTEKAYIQWLMAPKNLNALPAFVQKQIKLGQVISEKLNNIIDIQGAIESCLKRDSGWLDFYENSMEQCDTENNVHNVDLLKKLADKEIKFATFYWERNFAKAYKVLEEILDEARNVSEGLGAWYCLWAGYCLELLNDSTYENFYKRAYGACKEIPRHSINNALIKNTSFLEQICNAVNEFEFGKNSIVQPPNNFRNKLLPLSNSSGTSTNNVEEALRYLGQLLGFNSTRPDKEHDAGPDVLWLLNDTALAIEAKTDKDLNSEYSKKDVGQLAQHIQWVKDEYKLNRIIPIFVGYLNPAHKAASPSKDMMVAELIVFKSLADKLIAAYEDICKFAVPIGIPAEVEKIFTNRELIWPNILEQLKLKQLKSLSN
jgi:hypothetical protein